MDELEKLWQQYHTEMSFNVSVLPESLKQQGTILTFTPKSTVCLRGSFPEYIYFVLSGEAVGLREYVNGQEYSYFQLNAENGVVGLLEVLAHKKHHIATVVAKTELQVLRLPSSTVYRSLQNDLPLLRKCLAWLAQDFYARSGNDGLFYYSKAIDRVRFFLASFYEKHHRSKERLLIPVSYQEIAKQLGLSERTVGRSIQTLKQGAEITVDKKKIYLSNQQYMQLLTKIEID
ncbi:Crp/Fnr family transcriptional regulator [Enterococcus cecorum]|uniref:Crp/Fnr family transcriptional regulator n=1 Tax=Enterococcus cecorum TaxID=44008 RepID=UPI001FADE41F|nr:Crp/Fnr family transcriptional regulator [Enterococcus cecorum]MCJ0537976.1 Crp/Fnr family transcriptional regulator [Enterococcus cecorum]MCJ0546815.1 Crp/Fnr family transcriptional regulator [Enterococcus cecorum]MCJ0550591.1 Crp/Fnr family transcriptional regulator [Enterococcus cecorum]MCJ0569719.1 Crp/Fnr family transcriptional regulator [Enterococcus cecorum]CAI3269582.1 Crp/Fnr family transcriptional regulator [Enterococcus cecorum]